jgi:hypothetical protein
MSFVWTYEKWILQKKLYKLIKLGKFVIQFHVFEKNSKLKNYGFRSFENPSKNCQLS